MRILLVICLLGLAAPAAAQGDVAVDTERLEDPALEARAREIMREIRCLVCQNQSIVDSNAGLAADLREIVREQVADGRSEEEIKAFLVERYGDWVLLQPPLNPRTVALWALPPALLITVGAAALYRARRGAGRKGAPPPLTAEERARLDALGDDEGAS